MVYVELDSGLAIITGDNMYRKDPALSTQFSPASCTISAEAMRAVAKITREGRRILPMHDPVIYDEYPDGVR